ncbi:hypothetical protein BJ912DRAFT_1040703 [Pholiota molesta]|nr:hypothetical protein BJ912DRAFT_1040703 [Pholiota molesta]
MTQQIRDLRTTEKTEHAEGPKEQGEACRRESGTCRKMSPSAAVYLTPTPTQHPHPPQRPRTEPPAQTTIPGHKASIFSFTSHLSEATFKVGAPVASAPSNVLILGSASMMEIWDDMDRKVSQGVPLTRCTSCGTSPPRGNFNRLGIHGWFPILRSATAIGGTATFDATSKTRHSEQLNALLAFELRRDRGHGHVWWWAQGRRGSQIRMDQKSMYSCQRGAHYVPGPFTTSTLVVPARFLEEYICRCRKGAIVHMQAWLAIERLNTFLLVPPPTADHESAHGCFAPADIPELAIRSTTVFRSQSRTPLRTRYTLPPRRPTTYVQPTLGVGPVGPSLHAAAACTPTMPSARAKNAACNAASAARRCFGWMSGSEVVGLGSGGTGGAVYMVNFISNVWVLLRLSFGLRYRSRGPLQVG